MASVIELQTPDRLFTVVTHRSDHPLPWAEIPDDVLSLSLGRLLTPEVDRVARGTA